jgi:hypothetical protein
VKGLAVDLDAAAQRTPERIDVSRAERGLDRSIQLGRRDAGASQQPAELRLGRGVRPGGESAHGLARQPGAG